MAEIGIAASIIGIVGAGVKLSIATFDFASSIGSAGKELQHVAAEVSDLCAVLKHLHTLLDHAHFRPSSAAVKDLSKIIDHCSSVFREIDEVVSGLRSSRRDDVFPAATPDLINKVKWTFKRSKVQMQRSTLDACKSTLALMLNTMMLADSVSRRRLSSANPAGEEQDRAITQTLIIAQQCAVEELEYYEDELEKEEETARHLPGVKSSGRVNATHRRKSRTRLVGMFSGLSVITDLPTPKSVPVQTPGRTERASLWLDSIVAPPDGSWGPHPGVRRQKRLSSAGTANAPLQLLQRWTEHLDSLQDQPTDRMQQRTEDVSSVTWQDSRFSFVGATVDTEPDEPQIGVSRASTGMISPRTSRLHSISLCQTIQIQGALEMRSSHNIEDTYESVAEEVLREYGATTCSSNIDLCIHFGGKTKMLETTEQPLQMIRHYEDLDLEPRLYLRRKQL